MTRPPGYYYDTETGFYYLQSRYYDPAICRFLNADVFASTGQGFLGYNMFAYCGNNPICSMDGKGDYPTSTIAQDEFAGAAKVDPSDKIRVAIIYDENKSYGTRYNIPWLSGPAKGRIWERAGADVDFYPHSNTQGLIDSWNSLADKGYDFVYIYTHGNVNILGYTNAIGGLVNSFSMLHKIEVNDTIELYSCFGGKTRDGISAAQALANKANCIVIACDDEVYTSVLTGMAYRAHPFSSSWLTFFPQS